MWLECKCTLKNYEISLPVKRYMHPFFYFSYFLEMMIFFHVAQYPCMLKATLLKIIKKLPKNRNSKLDSKLKNSNSTRLDWKFLQLILSSTRLDPKICQLDSTRFDKFSTRSTPTSDTQRTRPIDRIRMTVSKKRYDLVACNCSLFG